MAGNSDGSVSGWFVAPLPGNGPGVSSSPAPESVPPSPDAPSVGEGAAPVGAAVAEASPVGVALGVRVAEADGDGVASSPPPEQPATRRLSAPTTANAAIGLDARSMLTGRPEDVDKGPGCNNGNSKVKVEGWIGRNHPHSGCTTAVAQPRHAGPVSMLFRSCPHERRDVWSTKPA
ncbi:hypothetical protein CURTO8I2_140083 [Curtobacterium sp. 8I-2]|nr:hypothetical protein CURTO8I2_140083 [Curtobacterium sp. 8I-2]